MKIAILGYGRQGISSYNYWKENNQIEIRDQFNIANPSNNVVVKTGENYLNDLDQFDLLIRSPKLYPLDIVKSNQSDILNKVTSNTNEFFRVCPTKNIIGVTGTKGKGTTSTLIARMLEKSGKRVHLGGNIGIPPLDLLNNDIKEDDYVVLELANFQLIDLKYSPHISVCLMVVAEHLDWHKSLEDYINSKKQLFKYQTTDDIAIYFNDNELSKEIVDAGQAQKIPYFKSPGAIIENEIIKIDNQNICHIKDLKLPGKHNLENVCAAITVVWQITKDIDAIKSTLLSFSSLPHRIELIRHYKDIDFYNDSFASVSDATIAAVEAINHKKVLIVGGYDRMLPLNNFVTKIVENKDTIEKILLIGQSANRVASELEKSSYYDFTILESKRMTEIVNYAINIAKPGQAIVLSPGFPSFDMFKDFEERGLIFKETVESL